MIRFGLCCIFKNQPIKFRQQTARYLSRFSTEERDRRLSEICRHNGLSLMRALIFCRANGIGGFRINSRILPLKTHPEVGYAIGDLPGGDEIVALFKECGEYARKHDIRTTFHPDQFITLSSPSSDVVRRSVAELVYQAEVAEWVHADVINLHAGGVHGDKPATLQRLKDNIRRLPPPVRQRLTLENDDRSYTPAELLPLCRGLDIPLVYDVHHHRCLPDHLDIAEATRLAAETWGGREPLFHLSSPADGWRGNGKKKHHARINPDDFPALWRSMGITVEVEAKDKEIAILKLMEDLSRIERRN